MRTKEDHDAPGPGEGVEQVAQLARDRGVAQKRVDVLENKHRIATGVHRHLQRGQGIALGATSLNPFGVAVVALGDGPVGDRPR